MTKSIGLALLIVAMTSCKKESTTPTATPPTSTVTTPTVYYGTYMGQSFSTVILTRYYSQGVQTSTNVSNVTDLGMCAISKGANNTILLSGPNLSGIPMKFTGTNFVVDKTLLNSSGTTSSYQSATGTLIGKELTLKSILTVKSVTGDVNNGDSTVVTRTSTGSVVLVE